MTYRLSRQADADLTEIYLDGLAAFGLGQAEKYAAGLMRCLEILAAQPLLARERREFRPPVRVHFYGVHVIIYIIEDDGILIVRLLHGRQDWERFL